MTPSRVVRVVLAFLLLSIVPSFATAATTELRVLFDVDNDATTGCTVNGMDGVDQVLVTQVTDDDSSSARVTRTHREVCTGSVLGGAIDIVTDGWDAGWNDTTKLLTLETRIPFTAFGSDDMPSTVHVGFDANRNGSVHTSLANQNGTPILIPEPPTRRRAVGVGPDRHIDMDGELADWGVIKPAVIGLASNGSSMLRLLRIMAWPDPADRHLYFAATAYLGSDHPWADDNMYLRLPGQSLAINAPGVLDNDGIPGGAPLTAEKVSDPARGTVTLNADGSFTYSPTHPQLLSDDEFEYKAIGDGKESNVARVIIQVSDGPNAPQDDEYTTPEDTKKIVAGPGLLENDPHADLLVASLFSAPSHGTVVINADGGFTYTPKPDFFGTDSFVYTAAKKQGVPEGIGGNATVTITVTPVNDAPSFSPGPSPVTTTAVSGPYSQLWATNISAGPANESDQVVNFAVSNNNQALFSVQPAISPNGTLTFTPAGVPGTATVSVRLEDNGGTANGGADTSPTVTFTINITCGTITVTNPATTAATTGVFFSETFTQSGAVGGATFTTTSTLPAGLTLATNGTLSGTPTQPGAFPIVVTVTDGSGCSATGPTYNLVVSCQSIVVTNPANSSGTASSPFSETFTQTGGNGPTIFSLASGTLPAGLTLASNGVLSGTPTQTGSFPITVMATDENGCTGTGPTYTIVIACQTISVTNPANANGTAASPFSETFLQAGGIGTTNFSLASGTLPAGLALAANGTLSGTPTQTGSFPITVTATDTNGCTGTSATYTIVIGCQTINVTNPANTAGTVSAPFSETFTETGAIGTATFTTASTLPAGLSLSTSGVLSGTPTEDGSFPIVVTVTDSNGCTGVGPTYTLVIGCQTINVTNPANTGGTVMAGFSETFTQTAAVGGATFTLASGTLPAGLTLATNGTLSGTPTEDGTFPITVTVTDGNGCTGTSATYTLVIACQTITVTNPANATGPAGSPFSETFTESGAVGGATFTTSSTLPTGLTLSTAGVLSGTPTQTGTFPIVVTVTDSNGCTGTSATYNLIITCQTITVTNPANANGTASSPFSETFTESGSIGGATFTTSSTLPAGLSLSTAGVLSGTPTQTGTFPIVVTVTDGNGCTGTSATYNLVIACQTITVTNPANGNGTAASAFSETFTQTGGIGTTNFSLASGTLPAGLTLAANGVLSGTPTQTGSFPITVTATDSNGCTGTGATYTIVIGCQTINVTNPANTAGSVSAAFSETFTETGAIGTATFTTASTLPAGLTLSTSGVLSGTPTEDGGFAIVVTVTDSNGCTGTSATYNLVIGCQTITVTNPANASGTVSAVFSETFTETAAVGGATFTLNSGVLPAGLTLATDGTLSGTPLQDGSFPITVLVTDGNGCTGVGPTYTLVIACQTITVTNPANDTGPAGTPFSETFTESGAVGGATFTTASTLPTGLTLSTAGVLSGTPTQGGTFPIVVTVTDGNGCTGTSATYNLVITCPTITVTNPANANGTAGSAFSETFTSSGGIGSMTYTLDSGTLPTGLSLAANGVLSGTPTQTGSFPITVLATDSNGCTGTSSTYTIVIGCQTITVTNPANAAGVAGAAFSETFTESGAIGGATFTLASGTLPAGLSLAPSGVLSGTPTQTGSFPITVTVTDSNGCTGTSATYNLTIACQTITVTNPANTGGTVNTAFSETFTQGGAIGSATFTTASTLPAGISLSTAGVLSGTPSEDGTFPIVVIVTDANGCTGSSATYNLVIACQTITVTNPANANGTVGVLFSETFTEAGALGGATFTTASTLPAGITLSAGGVLSGTPTQSGSFPIEVTVTDGQNGCTGVGSTYNLVIACQTITVTNPANAAGTVGSAFSETFTESGGIGAMTFTTSSTLPAGITLAANGVLSGTPTEDGSFPITVVATDSNGCTGTSSTYTLVIACQVITVNNPANANGTVDAAFSETFTNTGAIGAVTYTLASGTLPSGLTLAADGTLSGTPGQPGSFPITVTVTDVNGCTGTSATYNLVIACQTITVTNPAVSTATYLTAFNQTFTQVGVGTHTPATWTLATGTLPDGISLSTAGVLSGTPTETGTFPITVTVTDVNGCTGTGPTYTLSVAPVANADTFNGGVDNTHFVLTGGTTGTPSTPSVQVAGTIRANDLPSAATVTVVGGIFATTGGGSVTVAADGTFLYTAPVNSGLPAITTDSFTYTVTSNTGGVDPVTSAPATVTINLAGRVWYVKNDAAGGGSGQSHSPFNTLTAAQTASTANDHVFVYFGDGNTTGQNAGFTLKSGQTLHGQALVLVVNSATLVAAGSQPLIGNSGGDGVTIGNMTNTTIRGLSIAGSGNAIDMTTSAAAAGTTTITNNTIRGAGAEGIDVNLNAGTSGTLTLAITNNTWNTAGTHTGTAIDVTRTAGTLNANISSNTNVLSSGTAINVNGTITLTGFSGNTVHQNTGGSGMTLTGVTFDGTPGGTFQTVSAGATTIGVSGDGVGANGFVCTTCAGDLSFSSLQIFASGGAALRASGTTAYTGSAGLRIVGTGTDVYNATGGPAVDLTTVTMTLTPTQIVSINSTTQGVNLNGTAGTFTAGATSSITNATGTDFAMTADTSNVTYAGTITDDVGTLVSTSGVSGGTKAFTGAITDGDDGDGSGISLAGSGATVSFRGGLVLSTGGNAAFSATAGSVEVCDENPCNSVATGGLVNRITTTTGRALNVSNATITANHLEFRSISAGSGAIGPANGIFLNNTGSAGGLKVKGNGGTCTYATPTCTGGAIVSATGNAVHLVNTSNVSLTRMRIHDNDSNGIYGDELTGFSIDNSVVSDNDVTDVSAFEAGIKFNELYGTNSITNTVVRGTKGDNIRLEMGSGTLTNLTLTNATVGPTANVGGGYSNGFSIVTTGSPTLNVTVNTSTFTGVDSLKQQSSGILTSIGGGTTNLTVTGSTFEHENIGIDLGASSSGTHRFNIDNNDVRFHRTNAINIIGASTLDGTVNNNRVGNGTADSGSQNSFGIAMSQRGSANVRLAITNNMIRNTDFEGIFVRTGDLLAGDNGRTDLILTGNTVFTPDDNSGFPANPKGMHLRSRQATTLCMFISNNEAQGAGAAGYHLQESDTSSLSFQGWNTNAVTTLTNNGNTTAGGAPTTNEVGAPFAGACTTASPTFP